MGSAKQQYIEATEWHEADDVDNNLCTTCGAHVSSSRLRIKHRFDAYGDRYEYAPPNGMDLAIEKILDRDT